MNRVAIVHDWLVTYAGAERVLEQMLALYPDADLFAVCDFLPDSDRGFLRGHVPHTTFIQNLPFARRKYRSYLPLMPLAVEQLDLSGYDIVISSSHAVAKGVLTGPDQLHISYVHSPIRYAWDLQHQYLRQSGLDRGAQSVLARWLLHRIRLWDARTANGVDVFVANSGYVGRRIKKCYRRNAVVIYPPVDVANLRLHGRKEGFYLAASRMVPYKYMDIIVAAFALTPNRRLVVIGDGPQFAKVQQVAKGKPNIQLLGYQQTAVLRDYMERARAFVFAAEEDFGILPVEVQACGTPVIALGKGGALETVRSLGMEHATGLFFSEQTHEAVNAAIDEFERSGSTIDPQDCRINAERFSVERFREQFSELVEREWQAFRGHIHGGYVDATKPRSDS